MLARQRIWVLALVMALVALGVGGILITSLYRAHLEEERARLRATAQSNARLIEAVAAHELAEHGEDHADRAIAQTLNTVRVAHAAFEGFGNSGEFTLAQLDANQIVFLLSHRHQDLGSPASIPVSSTLAEPQRRALSGESGTMIGLDHSGEMVLAAFEPVAVPGQTLAIVAKIDLSEVRRPFIRAGIWGGMGGILLILLGALVFLRVGQPLVRHLAESEQLFRGVFQGATDGMMMADPVTGRFTLANEAMRRMLDRGEEEIRGLGVEDIVPEGDLPWVMEQFEQQVTGDRTSSVEIPLRRKDGSVFFADISSANIEWSGRSQMLGIFRDVTERKQAEDALRESEERYRALVEEMNDGFAIRDGEGILTFVNRRFCTMLGWPRDEIEGHHVTDFLDEQARETLRATWAHRTPSESDPYELTWTRRDGRKIVTIVSPTALQEAASDGAPSYASVISDITERKQAEEALREKSHIIQSASSAIATADMEGRMTYVNPSFLRAWGFEDDGDVLGRPFPEFWVVEERLDEIMDALRGRGQWSDEIHARRRDGSLFDAQVSAAMVVDTQDKPIALMSTTVDITERKQAEEALLESRDRLRKLAARLDEVREVERNLLARELHDAVGQALTAMRWDLDTLEEELPEGQEALVHRIHSMIDITDDAVRRVNRLSHELRSPVLELLGLEAAIEAHAVEFQERTGVEVESDFDLGDLEVRAERDEVALRIFQESLSNVLRHAEASHVWVRLRVEGEDVVLEVLDDGSGITDEQMQDSGSFGLIGMRERAGRLGGSVEIGRHSEGGTRVRAEIPIEPANGG